MAILRPATPGFLVTLVATILLVVVSFSVPLFKSIFFLKASLAVEGISGSITFGTLGYCVEMSNGTTCSKPTVGYELNINQLVGDNLPIQIPQVVVKWLTYALVLHIVALCLAAISAFFGLLAHVREMAMTCFSSCIAGFAAVVALLAFVFDLAFFFVAKSRINAVQGGSASMGNAIWLTLASWILLFFSGCFYGLGRCCIRRRPRGPGQNRDDTGPPAGGTTYADQMRLDAVKAEADRKARQKQGEVGLPAFNEYDDSQPLKATVDGDAVYTDDDEHAAVPYRDNGPNSAGLGVAGAYGRRPSQVSSGGYAGGYAQAPPGTRAVDEYYNTSPAGANAYPPQPQRHSSSHTQATSGYAPSNYAYAAAAVPPVANTNSRNQYLSPSPGPQYGHDQYGSSPGLDYGHTSGGTTYHSAVGSHQQYPSQYNDTYSPYAPQEPSFNTETYNNTAAFTSAPMPHSQSPPMPSSNEYYAPPAHSPPQRHYTLGGGGYGSNTVPQPPEPSSHGSFMPYPGETHMTSSPPPINIGIAVSPDSRSPGNTSPVKGPREQRGSMTYADEPPVYDGPGPSQVWTGGKR